MLIKKFFGIIFMLLAYSSYSQDNYHSILTLDSDLKDNANAVVRYASLDVTILSNDKMLIKDKRIVTVLNSKGKNQVGTVYYYDSNQKLKTLEAKVFNAFGAEIKKIKKKDFLDVSAVDGFSLYTDTRAKYINYTPTNYPYTIEYTEEYETSFTVAIPAWYPIQGYNVSVEKSTYSITNTSGIDISVKTKNLEAYNIESISDYHFEANNLKAIKSEDYNPAFSKIAPSVKMVLTNFTIEGVEGVNTSWMNFGKWMDDILLKDTRDLPQETIDEIKALTANAKTDVEKAKIVYQYVQDKTRYISVQVGIGGWKPMLASDVDRLGYGDCKGLSNYTKSLLDVVGVESYYTVVYGDNDIRDIDDSFSSLQGNHIILCLPQQDDNIWLECTSQTNPFGYVANFTDDRDVLTITPEGGKIQHTKVYNTIENLLETKASVNINENGGFQAEVNLKAFGTQYYFHQGITRKDAKDQDLHYKNYWSYLNTLKIDDYAFDNNKDDVEFTETLKLNTTKYASKVGDRLLLQPNFFNRVEDAPSNYNSRKLPFEVERGFVDIDEYQILIPHTFEVETLMEPVDISNKYGVYSASIENSNGTLTYKRKFQLNKGSYTKEEYKAFRDFWLDVIKNDKSKIVLKSK